MPDSARLSRPSQAARASIFTRETDTLEVDPIASSLASHASGTAASRRIFSPESTCHCHFPLAWGREGEMSRDNGLRVVGADLF